MLRRSTAVVAVVASAPGAVAGTAVGHPLSHHGRMVSVLAAPSRACGFHRSVSYKKDRTIKRPKWGPSIVEETDGATTSWSQLEDDAPSLPLRRRRPLPSSSSVKAQRKPRAISSVFYVGHGIHVAVRGGGGGGSLQKNLSSTPTEPHHRRSPSPTREGKASQVAGSNATGVEQSEGQQSTRKTSVVWSPSAKTFVEDLEKCSTGGALPYSSGHASNATCRGRRAKPSQSQQKRRSLSEEKIQRGSGTEGVMGDLCAFFDDALPSLYAHLVRQPSRSEAPSDTEVLRLPPLLLEQMIKEQDEAPLSAATSSSASSSLLLPTDAVAPRSADTTVMTSTPSTTPALLPTPVLRQVVESSGRVLQHLDRGCRETGRRYLDVLPAELVALLCVAVVPSAWHLEKHRNRNASITSTTTTTAAAAVLRSQPSPVEDESTAVRTNVSSSGSVSSPSLPYQEWGRLLSLRLVQVHDVLSPQVTASALRALQHGDLLSDDVLSPVAKSLLDPMYLQRHIRLHDHELGPESATQMLPSSSVGRPLVQFGYVSVSPLLSLEETRKDDVEKDGSDSTADLAQCAGNKPCHGSTAFDSSKADPLVSPIPASTAAAVEKDASSDGGDLATAALRSAMMMSSKKTDGSRDLLEQQVGNAGPSLPSLDERAPRKGENDRGDERSSLAREKYDDATQEDHIPEKHHRCNRSDAAAESVLDEETACRWACVLGRQSAPGHFHLHKIFHTLLLPPLTAGLRRAADAEAEARAAALVASSGSSSTHPTSMHTINCVSSSSSPASPSFQSWAVLHDLLRAFVRYAVSEEEAVHSLLTLCLQRLPQLSLPQLVKLLHSLTPSAQAAFVTAYRQRRATASPADGVPKGSLGSAAARPHHPKEELAAGCYDPLLEGVCQTMAQLFAMMIQLEEQTRGADRGQTDGMPEPSSSSPVTVSGTSAERAEERESVPPSTTTIKTTTRTTITTMPTVTATVSSSDWHEVWSLERATATALMTAPAFATSTVVPPPPPSLRLLVSPPWNVLFDSMMAVLRVQPFTATRSKSAPHIRLAWETAYTTNATLLLDALLRRHTQSARVDQHPLSSPENHKKTLFTRDHSRVRGGATQQDGGNTHTSTNTEKPIRGGEPEPSTLVDQEHPVPPNFTAQHAHHLLEALLCSSSSRGRVGRASSPPFHPLFPLLLRQLLQLVPPTTTTTTTTTIPREISSKRVRDDKREGDTHSAVPSKNRVPKEEDRYVIISGTSPLHDAHLASTVLRACVRLEEWWGVSLLHHDHQGGTTSASGADASRQAVLKLFRHHGSQLRPSAFVAALSLLSADYLRLSPSMDNTPLLSNMATSTSTTAASATAADFAARKAAILSLASNEAGGAGDVVLASPNTGALSSRVPLWHSLPPSSQAQITAHVTRLAVALPPKTLVKAMVALMEPQLRAMEMLQAAAESGAAARAVEGGGGATRGTNLPRHQHQPPLSTTESASASAMALSLVDPVSLHQWLSRFTAVDVVRQLGLRQCADVLYYIGKLSSFVVTEEQVRSSSAFASLVVAFSSLRRDNAMAVDALVRRSGAALLQTLQQDHEAELDPVEMGAQQYTPAQQQRRRLLAALQSVPRLVEGLRAADVLYPHLLSRLCRLVYLGTAAVDRTRPGGASSSLGLDDEDGEITAGASSSSSSTSTLTSRPLISLAELLPSFKAVAAEWRLRHSAASARVGGDGTLFRDAWETLRQRVMAMRWDEEEDKKESEEVEGGVVVVAVRLSSARRYATSGQGTGTHTHAESDHHPPHLLADPVHVMIPAAPYHALLVVVEAWNTFALLDPTDRPVFLVLLHRLWTLLLAVTRLATPMSLPRPMTTLEPEMRNELHQRPFNQEFADVNTTTTTTNNNNNNNQDSAGSPRAEQHDMEPGEDRSHEAPMRDRHADSGESLTPEHLAASSDGERAVVSSGMRRITTRNTLDPSLPPPAPTTTTPKVHVSRSYFTSLVLSSLDASALSTLVLTLLYKSTDASIRSTTTQGDDNDDDDDDDDVVQALLPPALLTLSSQEEGSRHLQQKLHPMDLTLLLISFLGAFVQVSSSSSSSARKGWLSIPVNLHVLHQAYDTCRAVFLQLYRESEVEEARLQEGETKANRFPQEQQVEEETAVPGGAVNKDHIKMKSKEEDDGEEEEDDESARMLIHPAMASEVSEAKVVPRSYFASVLIALANAGLEDPVLAIACATQLFQSQGHKNGAVAAAAVATGGGGTVANRTTTLPFLSAPELVRLFLALCFHFPPPPAPNTAPNEVLDVEPIEERQMQATSSSENNPSSPQSHTAAAAASSSSTTTNREHSNNGSAVVSKPYFTLSPSSPSPRQRFLRPVLDALWHRTEELDMASLHALRRCLLSGAGRVRNGKDGGGGEQEEDNAEMDPCESAATTTTTTTSTPAASAKVDEDFLLRLDEQEMFLKQRAAAARRLRQDLEPPPHQHPEPQQQSQEEVETSVKQGTERRADMGAVHDTDDTTTRMWGNHPAVTFPHHPADATTAPSGLPLASRQPRPHSLDESNAGGTTPAGGGNPHLSASLLFLDAAEGVMEDDKNVNDLGAVDIGLPSANTSTASHQIDRTRVETHPAESSRFPGEELGDVGQEGELLFDLLGNDERVE